MRVQKQLAEMRGEDRALRDKIDKNHETLSVKIDKNHETLNGKIEKNHERVTAQLTDLGKNLHALDARMKALLWVVSGLGTLIIVGVTLGKALHWF